MANHDLYKLLYQKVRRGDLDAVKQIIDQPDLKATISPEYGYYVLQLAVLAGHVHIVKELVELISAQDLEKQIGGYTTLAFASIYGEIPMAKAMVEKNREILGICSGNGSIPVSLAFSYGRNEMARYLYEVTPHDVLGKGTVAATIITQAIVHQINYDIAFKLLQKDSTLTLVDDVHKETPLYKLSCFPQAFSSRCQLTFWQKWIYNVFPIEAAIGNTNINCSSAPAPKNERSIKRKILNSVYRALQRLLLKFLQYSVFKRIYEMKKIHGNSLELLRFMCEKVVSDTELYNNAVLRPVYTAIYHGTNEFVKEVLKTNPEILWSSWNVGGQSRNMVAYTIENRQEEIYGIIYELVNNIEAMSFDLDQRKNNLLHIVGKLGPKARLERISGAALQMQRELQWFKEVEKLVPPSYIESTNYDLMTPRAVFTNDHKQLVIEGEKWMKETATSCTIAGALIVTIMFTAIFTVPGGYDGNSGSPIFLNEKKFMIFLLSDAISLFASTTSVLLFLGILTSRYAEEDFYKSLPTKLIFGLSTLFFSIAAMMVAFCTALFIIVGDKHWVFIPVIMLASVPVISFARMQFPFLVEIIKSTYGKGIFDRKKKSLI